MCHIYVGTLEISISAEFDKLGVESRVSGRRKSPGEFRGKAPVGGLWSEVSERLKHFNMCTALFCP